MIRQGGLGRNGVAGLITDPVSSQGRWVEGLKELSVGEVGWGDVVVYLNPYQHHVSDTVCLPGVRKGLPTAEDCHASTVLWRLRCLPNILLDVCGNK